MRGCHHRPVHTPTLTHSEGIQSRTRHLELKASTNGAACERDLIAASIHGTCAVGPSMQTNCTRSCFVMADMIHMCSKFRSARVFIINTRPDEMLEARCLGDGFLIFAFRFGVLGVGLFCCFSVGCFSVAFFLFGVMFGDSGYGFGGVCLISEARLSGDAKSCSKEQILPRICQAKKAQKRTQSAGACHASRVNHSH